MVLGVARLGVVVLGVARGESGFPLSVDEAACLFCRIRASSETGWPFTVSPPPVLVPLSLVEWERVCGFGTVREATLC